MATAQIKLNKIEYRSNFLLLSKFCIYFQNSPICYCYSNSNILISRAFLNIIARISKRVIIAHFDIFSANHFYRPLRSFRGRWIGHEKFLARQNYTHTERDTRLNERILRVKLVAASRGWSRGGRNLIPYRRNGPFLPFESRKHTYRFQFSALANLPLLLLYYFHMLERSVTKVSKRYVTKKLEIGIESENKEETVPFSLEGRKTRFAPHLRANTIGSVEWVNQRRDEIAPPPNVRLIESWIEEEWSGEQEYLTKLWVSAVSSFPSFFPIFLRFLLTVRPLFIADRAESLESAGRQPRLMSCDECPRWTRSPLSPSPSFSYQFPLFTDVSLSLSLSPFRPLSPEIPPLSLEFSESLDSASSSLSLLRLYFYFSFSFPFLHDHRSSRVR